ncbi:MAG: carboxylesterase/lipase family protein [Hyphomonadaceae bacterium]|nr:carboxylesterase/lipase family protein [Hyphomonadaceae bacterium]
MTHLAETANANARPPIRTQAGAVSGVDDGAVTRFLGVPYAAAPVGALRFATPQLPAPWDGVRDASARGFISPQVVPTDEELAKALPGLDIKPLIGNDQVQGDDFLVVNIWAPSGARANLPVMVFIHGGAFTGGAGAADVYDGGAFARAGLICVTINYRMGIEGFLPIPGAVTNIGLRDQIAALQWVQNNIAAFGGDAGNVTVFGESAGAMSIANLIVSPLTKGLFKRAIVQSGHGDMVRPIPVAQRLVKKIAKILRVKPTVEGFKSRTIEDGLVAQKKVSLPTARIDLRNTDGREPAFGLSRFLPVYGDDVLPEHPMTALKNGAGADVELLIGTNTEEMNLYFVPSKVRRTIGKFLANFVTRRAEPKAKDILKAYGIDDKSKRPGDAFTEALTDLVFRLPARRFALAHQGRTHVYEFAWRSTAYENQLGACHAMELPFVFDTLHTVRGPKGMAGESPPQELADRMNKIWADFAKTGDLPWPAYTAESRLACTLDTGVIAPEKPFPAERFLP